MNTRIFMAAVLSASACFLSVPAHAVDHNNIDAGRPLDYDDADSIAFREKSLEFGAALVKPESGKTGVEGSVEYLYGFAKNSHVSIDFDPRYSAEDGGKRRFDFGDVGVGIFHNFNREYGSTPALAIRADAYLPTGRGSSGVDFRLRGIASKQVGARGRLHLNLDANFHTGSRDDERSFVPGVIVGYSQPLGYPTRFDRTLLAQVGYRGASVRDGESVVTVGLGMRQQVGVQSVVDFGVLSDLTGGGEREKLKVVAGYSMQF